MRKIAPIVFKFTYVENLNTDGIEHAYNRLFELARRRMELDNKSTEEYSGVNGRNGNISDAGGSSKKVEGGTDYCLQNVSIQKDSGDKVWWGMENQSEKVDCITKSERK